MDGIGLMASAMHAAQARLDVAASNLANASTDGFRRRVMRATLTDAGIAMRTDVDSAAGPLRGTGRAFDLTVAGPGALWVRGIDGRSVTVRSASFRRDDAGHLSDGNGQMLLGERGLVTVPADATIDERGSVFVAGKRVDGLRTIPGTSVQSGFIEAANVDGISQMIEVVGAERAFETAQKTLGAIDDVRAKTVADVGRVKA